MNRSICSHFSFVFTLAAVCFLSAGPSAIAAEEVDPAIVQTWLPQIQAKIEAITGLQFQSTPRVIVSELATNEAYKEFVRSDPKVQIPGARHH